MCLFVWVCKRVLHACLGSPVFIVDQPHASHGNQFLSVLYFHWQLQCFLSVPFFHWELQCILISSVSSPWASVYSYQHWFSIGNSSVFLSAAFLHCKLQCVLISTVSPSWAAVYSYQCRRAHSCIHPAGRRGTTRIFTQRCHPHNSNTTNRYPKNHHGLCSVHAWLGYLKRITNTSYCHIFTDVYTHSTSCLARGTYFFVWWRGKNVVVRWVWESAYARCSRSSMRGSVRDFRVGFVVWVGMCGT